MLHNAIQYDLGLFLPVTKIIHERNTVIGLVTLTILADKTGYIIGFHAIPGNTEQRDQLVFESRLAAKKIDQPLNILRRKKGRLPGIGFAVHVFIVGIFRVEMSDPI